MALSRRAFVRSLGMGATAGAVAGRLPGGWVSARGREASGGEPAAAAAVPALEVPDALRLNSNENPNGPSALALDAIRRGLSEANRYPFLPVDQLTLAIARHYDVAPENVLLGCGSTEILRIAVQAYTGRGHALVTAAPTYETPGREAARLGTEVIAVPVDASLQLDLSGMQRPGSRAGLVYFCNPNNPTATVHGAASVRRFVHAVTGASGSTRVLMDEAYFEYVDAPSYATAIPIAMENRRVIVARTFSKVHGMAGLRIGYAVAHAGTINELRPFKLGLGINVLAIAAALGSIGQAGHIEKERRLNREAKDYTRRFFEQLGYKVGVSEANFVLVDIRRDAQAFQDACRALGVLVGRPFPPLTTHARISLGTLSEMRRASDVFRRVLAAPVTTARQG